MYEVENPIINFKEVEPKVVAYCCECNQEFTQDDTFLDFDGEYLCDVDCLTRYYGIKEVEGWEITE